MLYRKFFWSSLGRPCSLQYEDILLFYRKTFRYFLERLSILLQQGFLVLYRKVFLHNSYEILWRASKSRIPDNRWCDEGYVFEYICCHVAISEITSFCKWLKSASPFPTLCHLNMSWKYLGYFGRLLSSSSVVLLFFFSI